MFSHIAGPDLDERLVWIVNDLTSILERTDMSAILKDFGRSTRREDPVVHFYETFLAAYDPKMREARGVYYTPEPVVSYIVRSVDHILKNDFGLKDGLADATKIKLKDATDKTEKEIHRVLILEPGHGDGNLPASGHPPDPRYPLRARAAGRLEREKQLCLPASAATAFRFRAPHGALRRGPHEGRPASRSDGI
jgi:hypothetical protein